MVKAHGIDIVEVARIEHMLAEHAARFTQRCFTPAEQAYADAGQKRRAERYAVRFACKEAVMKALGTGWAEGVAWCDIEVTRTAAGRPGLALRGEPAQVATALGIACWHVSLSHTGGLALASVLGCGPPRSESSGTVLPGLE